MRLKNATNAARKFIATTDLNDFTVGIVGGGIGGLTAALAFADRGASVSVFEQAKEITEIGAGIQITPNAARVLDALGLLDYLPRIGVVAEAVVPVDGLTGRAVTAFDLTQQTPNYHFVHRAKFLDVLLNACLGRGVQIHTDSKVIDASEDGALSFQNAEAALSKFDLVVFADGIHSIGRDLIAGSSTPFFTGQVAWRSIVPGAMTNAAQVIMGPGRHLVLYPLGPNQINLVAVQERKDWAEEGWNHSDDPKNLQAAFSDFSDEIKNLLEKVDMVSLWGLFRHDVATQWSNGRLVMLGDAAHPTLPFLAQGANLAIEDAYVLARCVAEDGRKVGLDRFQRERKPRVSKAIEAANANAKNYHLSGVRRAASHLVLRGLGAVAPNAFLGRLSWLYDHDVTK